MQKLNGIQLTTARKEVAGNKKENILLTQIYPKDVQYTEAELLSAYSGPYFWLR